jgi:hypothetical protein
MNIIQTAVSQSDEMKPDRQRENTIILSDRSREIIRLVPRHSDYDSLDVTG